MARDMVRDVEYAAIFLSMTDQEQFLASHQTNERYPASVGEPST